MSILSHGFGRLKDLADVPSTVGNEGKFLGLDGAGNPIWDIPAGSGSGDVVGPGSATDNAVARFDTTTGKLIQNSTVTIDDSGNISTSGTIAARQILNATPKTANYTLTTADRFITVDADGTGGLSVFIPAASGNQGIVWTVKKGGTASDAVSIIPNGAETIDGAANFDLTKTNQVVSFTSDGTNIKILSEAQEPRIKPDDPISLLTNDVGYLESVEITDINATGTPSATTFLRGDGSWETPAGGGGSGDVVGPGSATDNAVARFDTATGKLIQNSIVTIDDSGNIATSGTVDGRDLSTDGTKLDGIAAGATANSSDATLLNRANHTGTQLAATVSNFQATVSANTDVAANTAARHAAVTVTDSSEINFTLTGQDITANIIAGSIDETKLDVSTNASLDLADTSLQPAAIGSTVQGFSSVLAATTASFTTADETKLDGIEAGAEVNNISDVNATDLTDGGDSTLHFHSADRNRTNHTGTQTASTISDFNSASDARIAAAAGVSIASLSGGKVPTSQLPALALTDVFTVASQAAQLALTAEEGDVAIRTDQNKSYVHNGGVAGTMADWSELLTPTDTVLSVNGETGAVTLTTDDISDSGQTNKWATAAEKTKLGHISITQAVDLDTIESDTVTNNAKATNATHTGDVTGATALTIAANAVTTTKIADANVTIAKLSATGTPDNTKFLRGDNTWAVPAGGGGGTTVNTDQVEVDFGSSETDSALVTVSAPWVLTTSKITCNAAAIDTSDHLADEVWAEGITAYPINIINGVSFDVVAKSCGDSGTTWGKYKVNYMAV